MCLIGIFDRNKLIEHHNKKSRLIFFLLRWIPMKEIKNIVETRKYTSYSLNDFNIHATLCQSIKN